MAKKITQILKRGDTGGKQARRVAHDDSTYISKTYVRLDKPRSTGLVVTRAAKGKGLPRVTRKSRKAAVKATNLERIADIIIAAIKAESF